MEANNKEATINEETRTNDHDGREEEETRTNDDFGEELQLTSEQKKLVLQAMENAGGWECSIHQVFDYEECRFKEGIFESGWTWWTRQKHSSASILAEEENLFKALSDYMEEVHSDTPEAYFQLLLEHEVDISPTTAALHHEELMLQGEEDFARDAMLHVLFGMFDTVEAEDLDVTADEEESNADTSGEEGNEEGSTL